MPDYFDKVSMIISWLYLYIMVPLTLLLQLYLLFTYSYNTIFEDKTEHQNRLRRGVASLVPFLISLYVVYISDQYNVVNTLYFPFYWLVIIGFAIGWGFMHWVAINRGDQELTVTLSCFVSSLLFFTTITIFVITQSFEMISIAFGFLFGVGFHVIVHGFSNTKAFAFQPLSRAWKKIKEWRHSSKKNKNNNSILNNDSDRAGKIDSV